MSGAGSPCLSMFGEISVVMTFSLYFLFCRLIQKLVGAHTLTRAHSLSETIPSGLSALKHSGGQQL